MHVYTIKKKHMVYKKKKSRLRKNVKRQLKARGWKWKNFMVNSPLREYKMKYNYKGH